MIFIEAYIILIIRETCREKNIFGDFIFCRFVWFLLVLYFSTFFLGTRGMVLVVQNAIVEDGRVVVQNVQGRQNRNQRNGARGNVQNRVRNAI